MQCWEPWSMIAGVVVLLCTAACVVILLIAKHLESSLYGDRSPQWPKLSIEWLKANKWCVVCGAKATVVHHIQPVSQRPDLELDKDNLASTCDRCHLFVGHLGAWQSWNPVFLSDALWWRKKIENRP